MSEADNHLAKKFYALSDPLRLLIVTTIVQNILRNSSNLIQIGEMGCSISDAAQWTGLSEEEAAIQLRILAEHGFLRKEIRHGQICYLIDEFSINEFKRDVVHALTPFKVAPSFLSESPYKARKFILS